MPPALHGLNGLLYPQFHLGPIKFQAVGLNLQNLSGVLGFYSATLLYSQGLQRSWRNEVRRPKGGQEERPISAGLCRGSHEMWSLAVGTAVSQKLKSLLTPPPHTQHTLLLNSLKNSFRHSSPLGERRELPPDRLRYLLVLQVWPVTIH